MTMNFQLKVPGKLMIAGEYAVLEPHQLAVVTAVSRYVTVTVTSSDRNCLHLPSLGLDNVEWMYQDNQIKTNSDDSRLTFIKLAIFTVFEYLGADNPLKEMFFAMKVESGLDEAATGKKFGLGSSAAVVVAIVKALLHIVGEFPQEIIYKIAATAHFRAQGSGSGADVAASTFGGMIAYTSFQPQWLAESLNHERPLRDLINASWPYFSWRQLKLPSNLHLCVGWTKSPIGTGPLVKKVNAFKKDNPEVFAKFLHESADAVTTFIKGLETGRSRLVLDGMDMNRKALVKLGDAAGVPIETETLKTLADMAELYGGKGKPSGAGGGDCGIAIIEGSDHDVEQLYDSWRLTGIEPLPFLIDD